MSHQPDLTGLILPTSALMKSMYSIRDALSLVPHKEHVATCINFRDLQEMRTTFLRELSNTIVPFVYSQDHQNELLERLANDRGIAGAWSEILRRSRKKFRASDLRGQFSELLLSALLQHYFKAVPLVRKMRLTTNPGLERNGADAIHVAQVSGSYELFYGEAKTYSTGGLRLALKDGVADAVARYQKAGDDDELDLYVYEDFVPRSLELLAEAHLSGSKSMRVNLVCIATYDHTDPITGTCREECLASIMDSVRIAARNQSLLSHLNKVDPKVMPRLHYIIFPVRALDSLVSEFKKVLGGWDGK